MANVQAAAGPRNLELPPLRWLWRCFTSVRFAVAIITFLALSTMIGVLIPQVPAPMRGNAAAIDVWLDFESKRYGFLTDPMYRLGLFDVFHSIWFAFGLGALVASVCVCTANRLPPIWRNVFHPQTRVPDDYFAAGQPVIAVETTDAGAIASALRRRRYRVTTAVEGGATYLFADRFPWSQFATFVSHLALILFLAGGLVTVVASRQVDVLAAEGEAPAPVFGLTDPDHMQLYIEDAVGRFNSAGQALDFRSTIVVYRDGKEVARGVTTVNKPLSYNGYRFHQSAYFPDGAALQVRDHASGRLLYDEVLALTSSAATPRVVVRDTAGNVLVDGLIVPTDFIADAAGTLVDVPGASRQLWIGAKPSSDAHGWQLVVLDAANESNNGALLLEGETTAFAGLSVSFIGVGEVPSTIVPDLPGSDSVNDTVAEISDGPDGPLLTVGPVQGRALVLSPGDAVTIGGNDYVFAGKREFSGITVRRDPGSMIIWLATGTFLLGLALTFYTPRRRLWGKIAAGQGYFRGLGGRRLAIEREIKQAASRAVPAAPENP